MLNLMNIIKEESIDSEMKTILHFSCYKVRNCVVSIQEKHF